MKVIGYLRTSSQTNVGEDKDSGKRQLRAIKSFCKNNKYEVADTFWDKNVSGNAELKDRPELIDALTYCEDNNINIIVVENSDRFSRSLVGGEIMLAHILKLGIKVVCSNNDKFSSDDDRDILMRQFDGAMNQFAKTQIVNRLRVSRNNKKKDNAKLRQRKYTTLDGRGKCEGAPQHYVNEEQGKLVREIKKMDARGGHSLRQIAMHMFWKHQMVNKNGMVLSAAQISRIIKYKSLRSK